MNWPTVRFETLYLAPSKNGIYKSKKFHGEGNRIVNMKELFGYSFIGNQEMQLLQLTSSEFERFCLLEGDLLFARRSLIEEGAGRCILVVAHNEPVVFESSIIRVRLNPECCDPRFYYYYFLSPTGRSRIKSIVTGVAQKGIRGTELKNILVHNPKKTVQNQIAGILSAYDDLIANNIRRKELLEESMHLLYREWFVHLRFPGYEHVKILDGIPDGWANIEIASLGKVVTGKTPSTKIREFYGGEIPFIKIPDMNGNIFVLSSKTTLTEDGADSQKNKYLPPKSIMVSCIGTVGVVSITSKASQTNQQINTIIPTHEYFTNYCYFALKELKSHLVAIGSSGATMGNVNKLKFEQSLLLLPSQQLLEEFHQISSPVFEQILILQISNQLLTQARDLLLPRLMNGCASV